jgi:hypothetical protein
LLEVVEERRIDVYGPTVEVWGLKQGEINRQTINGLYLELTKRTNPITHPRGVQPPGRNGRPGADWARRLCTWCTVTFEHEAPGLWPLSMADLERTPGSASGRILRNSPTDAAAAVAKATTRASRSLGWAEGSVKEVAVAVAALDAAAALTQTQSAELADALEKLERALDSVGIARKPGMAALLPHSPQPAAASPTAAPTAFTYAVQRAQLGADLEAQLADDEKAVYNEVGDLIRSYLKEAGDGDADPPVAVVIYAVRFTMALTAAGSMITSVEKRTFAGRTGYASVTHAGSSALADIKHAVSTSMQRNGLTATHRSGSPGPSSAIVR